MEPSVPVVRAMPREAIPRLSKLFLEPIDESQPNPQGDGAMDGTAAAWRNGVGKDWFTHAQEDMLKLDHIAGVGKLTGLLYRKSEKLGKESKDRIWNPDARAFAKAFKQSLDAYKHGNAIELPKHLEAEVDSIDKTKDKALKRLIRFV